MSNHSGIFFRLSWCLVVVLCTTSTTKTLLFLTFKPYRQSVVLNANAEVSIGSWTQGKVEENSIVSTECFWLFVCFFVLLIPSRPFPLARYWTRVTGILCIIGHRYRCTHFEQVGYVESEDRHPRDMMTAERHQPSITTSLFLPSSPFFFVYPSLCNSCCTSSEPHTPYIPTNIIFLYKASSQNEETFLDRYSLNDITWGILTKPGRSVCLSGTKTSVS